MVPAVVLAAQLGPGCKAVPFPCERDEQCDLGTDGRCIDGACAAKDSSCASGYRYSEHTVHGDVCTPGGDDDASVGEGTSDTGGVTAGDSTGDGGQSSDGGSDDASESSGGDAGCAVEIRGAAGRVCTRSEAGTVRCWGPPEGGVATRPGAVAITDTTALSVGESHACALIDGRAYCWGSNQAQIFSAALDATVYEEPQLVEGAAVPLAVDAIAAGRTSTCSAGNGTLYCTGAVASFIAMESWVSLEHPDPRSTVIELAVGTQHVCALDDAGAVYCAGANDVGQLGATEADGATLTRVVLPGLATSVAASRANTCAIVDGRLWCWGANENNQALPNAPGGAPHPPTDTGLQTEVVAVGVGPRATCAVDAAGDAWCIGRYFCTDEDTQAYAQRVAVAGAIAISVQRDASCLLDAAGAPQCWGESVAVTALGAAPEVCSATTPLPNACD